MNVRCIEIQIVAQVGILGLLDLKKLNVSNYRMLKDKIMPIIAKVSKELCIRHTNATKMKHEHTKCYSTCDITMAWSCRGKMQYCKHMQKRQNMSGNTCNYVKDTQI